MCVYVFFILYNIIGSIRLLGLQVIVYWLNCVTPYKFVTLRWVFKFRYFMTTCVVVRIYTFCTTSHFWSVFIVWGILIHVKNSPCLFRNQHLYSCHTGPLLYQLTFLRVVLNLIWPNTFIKSVINLTTNMHTHTFESFDIWIIET